MSYFAHRNDSLSLHALVDITQSMPSSIARLFLELRQGEADSVITGSYKERGDLLNRLCLNN